MPFITEAYEGFDVNSPYDWQLAETLVNKSEAGLPEIDKAPYETEAR